ncbi:hypothetical protein DSO57_1034226 [Entomophthora muscae]|uniref:Uncharacterized protein n=1 Tax=Entomophthora muscae TaxID=34485 RepID=A0ACC2TAX8_9FUNG|nr:hypothetical protein DSO57_1034226 [Entomophthora muscae]
MFINDDSGFKLYHKKNPLFSELVDQDWEDDFEIFESSLGVRVSKKEPEKKEKRFLNLILYQARLT